MAFESRCALCDAVIWRGMLSDTMTEEKTIQQEKASIEHRATHKLA